MKDHVLLVYDDAAPVPAEVAAMTGVRSFGDLLRRRERLSATVRRLAAAAELDDVLHVRSTEQLEQLATAARLRPDDQLYLLLPSHLAPTADGGDAALFLRKLALYGEPVGLWQEERPVPVALLDRDGLLSYFAAADRDDRNGFTHDHVARLPPVQDALGLKDLRDVASALEYLSGSFAARHFNQVEEDSYHVVKRSPDRDKIRREYRFYGFLPESLQPYFLQPYDFQDHGDSASYRTRRLFVPDLAVQWVHGVFTPGQFSQLLTRLLHFVAARPLREVGRERAEREAFDAYIGKTRRRVDELLAMEAGRAVDALLSGGGVDGGVRQLLARYEHLYEEIAPRQRLRALSVSHGDLGFSNILYSPGSQDFQLIDPRGADSEEEIYSDALYDVAKLSHSILGGYDFLVAGLFDLAHEDDLRLRLRVDDASAAPLRPLFEQALAAEGHDLRQVRLREAALFLSMLPLHIDVPRRVAAFALVADDIIGRLEEGRA